jgi:aldehyde dehydrogenase (NAD+)
MEKLWPKYFDTSFVALVNGGVHETTELLNERFDYIIFTGSPQIGKVVMQAAAKYLTPVTIEAGGKGPVYIDESADLNVTSRRLVWGKFANCGQTCVAPDYVLCSKEMQVN